MKKILVISGSPRIKGNSSLLCDEFIKGATQSGNVSEKIIISQKHVNYCTGCGACYSSHKCVQKDDMEEILEKMVDADVIVLATPVYFYSISGQLKTFIDRTVPRYEEVSNKDFYFILTAADSDEQMMNKTLETIRGFTQDCLENSQEKGIIYGLGAWKIGDIKNNPAMKEAFEMGKNV